VPVWRVFYVRPRAEKKAAARLESAGHEVFLPLRAAVRQWSDRKTTVEEALFPGYLFARVDERGRLAVLQDEAVVRCVAFGGRMAEVPEAEVAQLQALQAAPDRLAVGAQQAFPVGAEVYVTRGPLQGVRGTVVDHPKATYLLVEVASIRQRSRFISPPTGLSGRWRVPTDRGAVASGSRWRQGRSGREGDPLRRWASREMPRGGRLDAGGSSAGTTFLPCPGGHSVCFGGLAQLP